MKHNINKKIALLITGLLLGLTSIVLLQSTQTQASIIIVPEPNSSSSFSSMSFNNDYRNYNNAYNSIKINFPNAVCNTSSSNSSMIQQPKIFSQEDQQKIVQAFSMLISSVLSQTKFTNQQLPPEIQMNITIGPAQQSSVSSFSYDQNEPIVQSYYSSYSYDCTW